MFTKILDVFRKKRLFDPSRRGSMFIEYDKDRGYQAYHEFCQTACEKPLERKREDFLTQCGLEHITILDSKEALQALKTITAKAQASVQKKNIDYSEVLTVQDRAFIDTLFKKIFTPRLNQKLISYFKSEYCIYWYSILRATPSPQARRSFLWHCDKGPRCHIKLLVYLNGTDEHGGNTQFLDRETTAKFSQTGYLFGPVDARQADLSTLAKSASISYKPKQWDLRPGDGILFEPSRILHCGILPTKGPRYVLAFCLLPSPLPWDEAFKQTNNENLSKDYTWHTKAIDILESFTL